jgi:D-glycero-alpha-D-manno-heptose-7-phosphate kinase
LYEILNLVKEAKILLKNKSFDDFGRLLHETWLLKKKLSIIVSNKNIDDLYNAGLRAGAIGGKLLGAGGGGFFLFYVKRENHENFIKSFKRNVVIPIQLSNEGSEIIFNNEEK